MLRNSVFRCDARAPPAFLWFPTSYRTEKGPGRPRPAVPQVTQRAAAASQVLSPPDPLCLPVPLFLSNAHFPFPSSATQMNRTAGPVTRHPHPGSPVAAPASGTRVLLTLFVTSLFLLWTLLKLLPLGCQPPTRSSRVTGSRVGPLSGRGDRWRHTQ